MQSTLAHSIAARIIVMQARMTNNENCDSVPLEAALDAPNQHVKVVDPVFVHVFRNELRERVEPLENALANGVASAEYTTRATC